VCVYVERTLRTAETRRVCSVSFSAGGKICHPGTKPVPGAKSAIPGTTPVPGAKSAIPGTKTNLEKQKGPYLLLPRLTRLYACIFSVNRIRSEIIPFSSLHGCRVGEAARPGPRPESLKAPRIGIDLEQPLISAAELKLRQKCLEVFDAWLFANFCGLCTEDIFNNGALMGRLLREYGKHMFKEEESERAFREAILGVRDRHQHLRWSLGGAWELAERWTAREPGRCRTVLSRKAMLGMVSVALIWRWWRMSAVLLMGFTCPFHPSELTELFRADLVLPSDQLEYEENLEAYVRIPEPKTRHRGPRRQHGMIDDVAVVRFLEALFCNAPPREPIFPPGKYGFRTRWDAICRALGVVPRDIPSGAVPAVIRGSAATEIFRRSKSIPLTMWKGRWQTQRTLEHYLQETGGHSFLALQSDATRSRIGLAASAATGLLAAATLELTLARH
jgi:hypothetical protein